MITFYVSYDIPNYTIPTSSNKQNFFVSIYKTLIQLYS